MKYLLDTNTIIALFKGNKLFVDRLRSHHVRDFGISSIVFHELLYVNFPQYPCRINCPEHRKHTGQGAAGRQQ